MTLFLFSSPAFHCWALRGSFARRMWLKAPSQNFRNRVAFGKALIRPRSGSRGKAGCPVPTRRGRIRQVSPEQQPQGGPHSQARCGPQSGL